MVDDDEDVLLAAKMLLKKYNYHVIIEKNPTTAARVAVAPSGDPSVTRRRRQPRELSWRRPARDRGARPDIRFRATLKMSARAAQARCSRRSRDRRARRALVSTPSPRRNTHARASNRRGGGNSPRRCSRGFPDENRPRGSLNAGAHHRGTQQARLEPCHARPRPWNGACAFPPKSVAPARRIEIEILETHCGGC